MFKGTTGKGEKKKKLLGEDPSEPVAPEEGVTLRETLLAGARAKGENKAP